MGCSGGAVPGRAAIRPLTQAAGTWALMVSVATDEEVSPSLFKQGTGSPD